MGTALGRPGLGAGVRAPELPPALADPQGPLPPACPVPTAQLDSLWECFGKQMTDPRKPKADKALTLVNFQTTEQRLVDQVAVPQEYQRGSGRRRPFAQDGFGRGVFDGRRRSHHQS